MGLTLTLISPHLADDSSRSETDSWASSAILRGSNVSKPKTKFKTETEDNDGIKYLPKNGPPTILGPTPGNVPNRNPVTGAPTIRPPDDTTGKVPDNSTYDTLQMTPDVDWINKKMLKAPKEK